MILAFECVHRYQGQMYNVWEDKRGGGEGPKGF